MTRKDEFLEKFKALLREYDAEISIETITKGFQEHHYIQIYSDSSYNKFYECIAEGFEINLGEWENGK